MIWILALIGLICGSAFLLGRLLATPDLGSGPQGKSNGDAPQLLANYIAAQVTAGFQAADHVVVTLNEHDLTVIARQRNPDPQRFVDPEVRIRKQLVVVDATSAIGPFTVTSTVRLNITLTGVDENNPHILTDIVDFQIGNQTIPDFLRAGYDPRGTGTLSLDPILNDSPNLKGMRQLLECIVIADTGIRLGFHREGAVRNPASCN